MKEYNKIAENFKFWVTPDQAHDDLRDTLHTSDFVQYMPKPPKPRNSGGGLTGYIIDYMLVSHYRKRTKPTRPDRQRLSPGDKKWRGGGPDVLGLLLRVYLAC